MERSWSEYPAWQRSQNETAWACRRDELARMGESSRMENLAALVGGGFLALAIMAQVILHPIAAIFAVWMGLKAIAIVVAIMVVFFGLGALGMGAKYVFMQAVRKVFA